MANGQAECVSESACELDEYGYLFDPLRSEKNNNGDCLCLNNYYEHMPFVLNLVTAQWSGECRPEYGVFATNPAGYAGTLSCTEADVAGATPTPCTG